MTLIHDSAPFKLHSYGMGFAYRLVHVALDRDIWFEGDDATQFCDELDARAVAQPDRLYADILRELWDRYDVNAQPCVSTAQVGTCARRA